MAFKHSNKQEMSPGKQNNSIYIKSKFVSNISNLKNRYYWLNMSVLAENLKPLPFNFYKPCGCLQLPFRMTVECWSILYSLTNI